MTPIHTKKIIHIKKYIYKSENILMIPFYTNNNHVKKACLQIHTQTYT